MYDISVVIPTYKRPMLLLNCIRKLENQTVSTEKFEVLVVTDGYDEVTHKVINDYRKSSALNLICYSTKEKKGPAAARNLGWQLAKSKVVAFTDDDCLPECDWLEVYVTKVKELMMASDISGSKSEMNEKPIALSGFTKVPIDENPTDFALNTHGLQYADFITANCACTVSALKATGGFDERYGTAWREDSDLEFSFLKNNIPVIKVLEAVVVHPVREAPWGISIKEQKKGLYDALLYKKFPELYRERLSPKIIFDFYFIVLAGLVCLVALLFGWWYIAGMTFLTVLIMISAFFMKRIKETRKSYNHILEMLVTSSVIPFLSVFWRLYGSLKFRVMFFIF
jgi:glycosyltransferase involved in cell wall biosynthesis